MNRTVCDWCGRIAGAHVPMDGWYIDIPDHIDEPWLAACSRYCAEELGYETTTLAN